jgi:hypothetical protein
LTLGYDRNEEGICLMLENKNKVRSRKGLLRSTSALLMSLSLAALAISPRQVFAQDHLVSRDELRNQILTAQQTRQNQLHDLRKFLSSDAVQESFRSVRLDPKQIRDAVSLLDDAELANLADRTRGIESDLRAGALTNEQLTYIVIALATAVIVILAT